MVKMNKEALFIVFAIVLFYIVTYMARVCVHNMYYNPEACYILSALIYVFILMAVCKASGLKNTSEGFWDVSDYAQCKGGPYFWQGDSPVAKRCRELANTPEGRCGISSYNCPTGYVGTPKLPFYYTPLSDDQWKNEQCEDKPTCPCQDVGLCGMEKQVE
jgi:hypothetical protein